jgi:hypothetical protein
VRADGGDDAGRPAGGDAAADGSVTGDGEVTVKTNLQLPNGVLVDVLA